MDSFRICILIPTYNNAGTVADVVRRALSQGHDVIVVNDGSTDDTLERLSALPVTLINHASNKGKGAALRTGLRKARELGYDYAVTLDSDGQHFPEDIPLFIEALSLAAGDSAGKKAAAVLVVGSRNLKAENMPGKNTFANKFSNFWFHIQTAQNIPDTQTGFRAYPLSSLPCLGLLTSRYEAELELLVFSAWRGVRLLPVPIRVYYPPEGERVSHFRPFRDFFRISVLNTALCVLALIYGYPRLLLGRLRKSFR